VSDDPFSRRLDVLRAQTRAGFVERAEAFEEAAAALRRGDPEARIALQRLAHRLNGVAGTVGAAALGAEAGALEAGCKRGATAVALAEAAEALAQHARRIGSAERSRSARVVEATTTGPETAAQRVLVVDDDPSMRRMLKLVLDHAPGFEAVAVTTIEEALRHLEEVAVVISDAQLAGSEDGRTIYRAWRARSPSGPFLFVSASTTEELGWSLVDDPARRWLLKPFRPGRVLDALRDLQPG
jgi:CheY-like chemotaxis protein/HPt (histidine-containing phosphotransfer) domain-containing protein